MRVRYKHCCGVDIHKQFVVACLLRTSAEGSVEKEIRTFSTMTNELLTVCDWLGAQGCTQVVMESTASFWRPIDHWLEGQVELLVVNAAHVNAAHVKAVPGRKTAVKDAEWLAELLRHGLVRGSFIPSPSQPQLRDLTRYRMQLIEERARLTNRVQVVLEDANSKPHPSSPPS
jgi:transposase